MISQESLAVLKENFVQKRELELKEEILNSKFKMTTTTPTYDSDIPMNKVQYIINNGISKTLQDACFRAFMALQSHATKFNNYTITSLSMKTIGKEINKSRQRVSVLLHAMANIGLFTMERVGGYNVAHVYVITIKKELIEANKELGEAKDNIANEWREYCRANGLIKTDDNDNGDLNEKPNKFNKGKKGSSKPPYTPYPKKPSNFNDYDQRNYNFDMLEKGLLGHADFEFNECVVE